MRTCDHEYVPSFIPFGWSFLLKLGISISLRRFVLKICFQVSEYTEYWLSIEKVWHTSGTWVSCNLLCRRLVDSTVKHSSFLSRYHGYHIFVHLCRVFRHRRTAENFGLCIHGHQFGHPEKFSRGEIIQGECRNFHRARGLFPAGVEFHDLSCVFVCFLVESWPSLRV